MPPLQLFLRINISYLKNKTIGHFTAYETVTSPIWPQFSLDIGGCKVGLSCPESVLKAYLTLNALNGGSVVGGFSSDRKGTFSPCDVLQHTHKAETQPFCRQDLPLDANARQKGELKPGEGLKALQFAFRGLPLSVHQPAPHRAFLWLPGATWRSTAGGQLGLKIQTSDGIMRDTLTGLKRHHHTTLMAEHSLNVWCACNILLAFLHLLLCWNPPKKKKKKWKRPKEALATRKSCGVLGEGKIFTKPSTASCRRKLGLQTPSQQRKSPKAKAARNR